MQIVFVSNFYNHHQAPCAEFLYQITHGEYRFISCEYMSEERRKMGWGINEPSFVKHLDENYNECIDYINNAEVVVHGSAPFNLLVPRLKSKKITFIYSERLDKQKESFLRFIKHYVYYQTHYAKYDTLYCLCASAYTSFDFSRRHCFVDKCYKWGYFPKITSLSSLDELHQKKENEVVRILYVSRLIPLKHPEYPLMLAKNLKEEGIDFTLTIVGQGQLEQYVQQYIWDNDLSENITLIPVISPDEVREKMNSTNIFLFTSDRNEGWGAVVNEAMSSACAVVASSAVGSVPFLIDDRKNGIIYEDGNFDDFYRKVRVLCLDKDFCRKLGDTAYSSIMNEWNAEEAAQRLIALINDIKERKTSNRYADGPCSKAMILKDGWYRDE